MNSAQLHLALNHLPVLGTIFAILLLGYALLRRSDEVIRVGLFVLILAGIAAIPVFLTGEPAEEIVENLAGVSKSLIEEHEGYAKFALGTAILSGAVALLSLLFSLWDEKKATWLVVATFFLALITGGWMLKTASLGGQIRHSEIRDTTATQTEQKSEKDDDDDH